MSNTFIDDLLGQMTLEEKVSMLAGTNMWHTVPVERLGIPSLKMTDGPNGARGAGRQSDAVKTTCFPAGIALASTWNTDLVERIGQALADETRLKGAQVLLGPTVNIQRSPLGGRNFECFSEDPYLTARLAVAYIHGLQQEGVGASIKHYVCNDQEFERFSISVEVRERTLREIYLAPFEAAVRECQPWTIMAAYNLVNGVPASESQYLLTEILRDEWGYDGVVVSDWFESVKSTAAAVNAGLDVEMPSPRWRGEKLLAAVERGEVAEATIDTSVRRLLLLLDKAGRFAHPEALAEQAVDLPERRALVRAAAAEGMVLLKNDRQVLPLESGQFTSIAVIGPNAKVAQIMGGGSAHVNPHYAVTPYEGIMAKVGDHVHVGYEEGVQPSIRADAIEQAARLAAASDVAIVCVGFGSEWQSEGFDRPDMDLPGQQNALVEQVAMANPRTVVVLNTGSPITMPWLDQVAAIIQAWYPGQECGNAIADVLFGDVTPSGKLPQTFPVRLEDNPAYLNYPGENGKVYYGEGLFVGYRYYDKKGVAPLFPFGFGLSYTTFSYSPLRLSAQEINASDTLQISVDITNTGPRAGQEVVQLYLRDRQARLQRPDKELKAFAKVYLEPGESKTVTLSIGRSALACYDDLAREWVAEAGEFEALVGASSRDIRAAATFVLSDAGSPQ